jgi:hypothetical protein
MKITRRGFGKLCASGLVALAAQAPALAAARGLLTDDDRCLSLAGPDPACGSFAHRLRLASTRAPRVLRYDGEVEEIEAVRIVLTQCRARRLTNDAPQQYFAGMVGIHAYSVLETLLRDAGATLILEGQHVRRRGRERHAFLTTARSAGAGDAFDALTGRLVRSDCVTERCLARPRRPVYPLASPIPRRLRRTQALALVYGRVLEPSGPAALAPEDKKAEKQLNHVSFLYAV